MKNSSPNLLLQGRLSRNAVSGKSFRIDLGKESWERHFMQWKRHKNIHALREQQKIDIIREQFE